ncbi:MAG TPA: hypothetical protein VN522_12525 [Solirubrobacterales bacterium]|nr:hypothetical protein [Solirubrobacterales bacterium]
MGVKNLGAALFAALALGAMTAGSVFAAPATVKSYWLENGATPSGSTATKCSKASESLSLKSTVAGSPVWLTATAVECVTGSKIEHTPVEGVEMAVGSGTLRFTGLTVMEPAGCTVAESTITTEPLVSNVELEGESVYQKIAPAPGKTKLATVKLRNCAAEGNYNVTGFVRGLEANKTGVESTNQKLKFNSTSNAVSELKLGGNTATLEGEVNNELVSGGKFTAVEIGGANPQSISLVPDHNQAGGVCRPTVPPGKVEFLAEHETCEYRFENNNPAVSGEPIQVTEIIFTDDEAECQSFFSGNCIRLVSVEAAHEEEECMAPGLITGATVLAPGGGKCYLKLEYKWVVVSKLANTSLEVKTRSLTMGVNASVVKGQVANK